MIRVLVLGGLLLAPAAVLACPGSKAAAGERDAQRDPTACAKKADLVGANCSYTTGKMAQRVLEQGRAWSFTGSLASTENLLASKVAAPYSVGPEGRVKVVANEILEDLISGGLLAGRVVLEGRLLEVDGVEYAVLTSFGPPNS